MTALKAAFTGFASCHAGTRSCPPLNSPYRNGQQRAARRATECSALAGSPGACWEAFLPYIGAIVTGLLAVLVALASGGPALALAVVALIVVVQQLDGNVIEPLITARVLQLPAFVVIVAVTVGATLLRVLGTFLAVPVAACIAARSASCASGRPKTGATTTSATRRPRCRTAKPGVPDAWLDRGLWADR